MNLPSGRRGGDVMGGYRAQFEEHAGHRLAVMLDAEDMSAGVMCETCGEYVIEWDDYEPPPTEGAVEDVARLRVSMRRVLDKHGCECGVCVDAEHAIPPHDAGER